MATIWVDYVDYIHHLINQYIYLNLAPIILTFTSSEDTRLSATDQSVTIYIYIYGQSAVEVDNIFYIND